MIAAALAIALALIPSPRALVVYGPCPDATAASACTYADQGLIYAPKGTSRFAIEHERGHVFDQQLLGPGERHALQGAMGLPESRPWRTGTGLTAEGLSSPSERFADLYAACRLRLDPETRWESAYDYQPSRRAFRHACGVVRRAGRDYGDGTTR